MATNRATRDSLPRAAWPPSPTTAHASQIVSERWILHRYTEQQLENQIPHRTRYLFFTCSTDLINSSVQRRLSSLVNFSFGGIVSATICLRDSPIVSQLLPDCISESTLGESSVHRGTAALLSEHAEPALCSSFSASAIRSLCFKNSR